VLLLALAFPPESSRAPRILLVEDHQDTREMYVEYLRLSFDVLEASNGHEGLALALRHRPDVIVTDMSLPGMDGFELAASVRRHAAISRTPVLCLSGYSGELHEERARKARCTALVQKPCLPDALAQAVLQVLAAPGHPE
jgi:CheY-like chemotaxis protein